MLLVIPVFIPHEGCPHCCVFCNQRRISGFTEKPVSAADVRATIETWLAREQSNQRRVQVAFYGGSFTGLPGQRQQELLAAVAPFVEQHRVQAIRLSTRPDYIDADRVDFLQARSVSIVELGVQSMDDGVLVESGRGHTAADVERAVAVLRDAGMETGLQLMLGLPGETRRIMMDTVQRIIELQPDFVRIYPVLVVQNSALADKYLQGNYQPLSLDKAVIMSSWMKKKFDRAGIRVVRMGLQAGPDLEKSLIAGPWHPAFGELVKSRIMLQQTRIQLSGVSPVRPVRLVISDKDQSIFRGMKSVNIKRLQDLGWWEHITLAADPSQPRQTVRIVPDP
jgi:histone acetyltransferase (RNA polymerase elongator complex component)